MIIVIRLITMIMINPCHHCLHILAIIIILMQDIELDNAIIEEDDELVGEEVKGEMARYAVKNHDDNGLQVRWYNFEHRFMDDMELGGLEQVPALSGRVLR